MDLYADYFDKIVGIAFKPAEEQAAGMDDHFTNNVHKFLAAVDAHAAKG